jgi:peptidoglycan/xylan/chitin deacetylase (PgdA/CDA1 family)
MSPLSPDGPLKIAISVDDVFLWPGVPFPDGYSAGSVTQTLTRWFAEYGVPGVYAFSATAPMDGDPSAPDVLDAWCEAGHHVGSHTHNHPSLNWLPAQDYIADIERSVALIEPWIARAPTRYFRYAFDMWGDTAAKTDEVQAHLARTGYLPAPISTWFYDAQFVAPYLRATVTQDREAQRWVQDAYVETAVSQLRHQVAAARRMFGRDPIQIALVHGTPITGDTYGRVLEQYAELGAEFVTLEEALEDPVNQIVPPTVTRYFRNSTQKWAAYLGDTVEDAPPAILDRVRAVAPVPELDERVIFGEAFDSIGRAVGATPVMADLDW